MDDRERAEYIELRRQELLTALTIGQRVARHWAWFWAFDLVVATLLITPPLLVWIFT